MSLKKKILNILMSTFAILAFSSFVLAQQTTPTSPQNPENQQDGYKKRGGKRAGMKEGKRGGDRFMMRGLQQLNLSDAQKQQTRAIFEKYKGSQTNREDMRGLMQKKRDGSITPEEETRLKNAKRQMRASSQQMHNEILAILTPAQRTQLEQMKEQMRQKMQERRQNKQTQLPPTQIN